jgi:hypothetical protein
MGSHFDCLVMRIVISFKSAEWVDLRRAIVMASCLRLVSEVSCEIID